MSDLQVVHNAHTRQSGQYITFRVGDEYFGVSIMCVEEIIIPRPYTAIPRTPDYFLGIINLRGEVISIISMRSRFAMAADENSETRRIVVIQANGMKLGLMVDEIRSIINLSEEQIQGSSPLIANDRQQYISGSSKMDDDTILLILDQEKLISQSDFYIDTELQPSLADIEASRPAEPEDLVKELFLVGFSIGTEHFCIESIGVDEIITLPEVTVVPEMSDYIEGIIQLRESVIPLMRLANKLDAEANKTLEDCPVIIVTVFGVKLGLIVDQITEVYLVKETEVLEPPINLSAAQQEQLRGVIKVQKGEKENIVMFLLLEKLFTAQEQEIFQELDSQNAPAIEEEKDLEEEVPILEFILNNEKYALLVSEANEIIPTREIVPVPKSPKYIEGVINLRGEVVSIVHLPKLVGSTKYEETAQTKFLIVESKDGKTGLIVDQIIGIKKTLLSSFKSPSGLVQQQGNVFLQGMKQDEDGENIIVMIDLEQTLYQAQNPDVNPEQVEGLIGLQRDLENLDEEEQALLGEK